MYKLLTLHAVTWIQHGLENVEALFSTSREDDEHGELLLLTSYSKPSVLY